MNNELAARKEELKPHLMAVKKQISSLLQDENKANKFLAASLVVASDHQLNKCSPDSIAQALVGVAMSDLNIDSNMGQCYLVKYGDQARLQIGYKGFIQLLFRAGWMVKCFPVYLCDNFEMSFDGWDNKVDFRPNIDERDEGNNEWTFENLRGIYVVSRHKETKDEYSTFVSKAIIEKLRLTSSNQKIGNYTKAADKERLKNGLPIGIWESWYIEMAQAKAVKKLAKILPIGDSRAAMAVAIDDKQEQGKGVDYKTAMDSGVIIDMQINEKEEKQDVLELIRRIKSVETSDELADLSSEAEKFAGANLKSIRVAWKEKSQELKSQANKPDWRALIEACQSADELTALLSKMTEDEMLSMESVIDPKFDSFR